MALQVWLPLNGNLNNQGLANIVPVNHGATVAEKGKIGKGYSFDGSNDYIDCGYGKDIPNKQLTITMWVKPQAALNDRFIMGCGNGNNQRLYIGVKNNTYNLAFGDFLWGRTTNATISTGRWDFLAITIDNYTATLYCNNVEVESVTKSAFVFPSNFYLGGRNDGYYANIIMNDVRIYDECLSMAQLKEISKGLVAHYKLSGEGGINLLPLGGLKNSGASSVTYDKYTDTYTIVSPVGATTWGYGVCINQDLKVTIPYGADYRISAEVYVPTAHTLKFDYNNVSADSATLASWGGNDNDNTSTRLASSFSIPANQWTHIVAGSSNTHASNTAGVGIVEYSLFGLYTANDTESVTWYIRHPKVELGSIATEWSPAGLGYLSQESDLSGYGNTLNFSAIKPHGVGEHARYTGSYQFHGKNTEYMYGNTLNWLTSPFTFNCWCNQTSRTSEKGSTETTTLQFVESQGRDCGLAGFSLVLANGVPRIYLGTETDGTYHQINSDTALALNTWHMLTGTYDGTTVKLYVDGVLKSSKAVTTAIDWSQATGFTIGKMAYQHTTTTNYFPFNGYINDVRVYATALSADDVSKLYHKGAYVDDKGHIGAYEFVEVD